MFLFVLGKPKRSSMLRRSPGPTLHCVRWRREAFRDHHAAFSHVAEHIASRNPPLKRDRASHADHSARVQPSSDNTFSHSREYGDLSNTK
jgi:hypothetical protein